MVRKQVYIEPRQDELLKQRARETGSSEAELIRRGIDAVTGDDAATSEQLRIWQEEKQWIQEHRRMHVAQTARGWTRDDLYEERITRLTR